MHDGIDELEVILIADDDAASRRMLQATVEKLGYRTRLVADGLDAFAVLSAADAPAMALLDWEMPGMSGLEVIRRVRADMPFSLAYFIMVTSRSSRAEVIEGIERGADDYIVKPFDAGELGVRIRAGERIIRLQRRLVEANRRLEIQAKTDGLTGFYNRLALYSDLARSLDVKTAGVQCATLIMVDLDHFKVVNDTHGHAAGDAVLEQFAVRVKALLREGDAVCRMGGEEFLVIAPGTSAAAGLRVAERVRETIQNEPFTLPDGRAVTVTCSLGCHTGVVGGTKDAFSDQIKKADLALYEAKRQGRNCVVVYESSGGTVSPDGTAEDGRLHGTICP